MLLVHLGRSERVLRDKYRQTYDGAASEVDDVVDSDHLQVQHHLSGSLDGPWEDECGAHVTGLLRDEGETGEECESNVQENTGIWQLHMMEEIQDSRSCCHIVYN